LIGNFIVAAVEPAVRPPAVPPAHPGIVPPAAAVPTAPPTPAPLTFFQAHVPWLTHSIATLFIACAIGLIVLLAVQTTKQEGLSGTIGGRVESAYRGRLGAEEQLKRLTGWVAVTFVITAFILSLTGI
jgi:protein translocase SecG subunit